MHEVKSDTLLAVRAGRLFDGERSIGPGTVLIGCGRIVDVDTTGATPPAHANVIDLGSNVFLLPGLIDAHVHLAFDASPDVVAGIDAVDDKQLVTQMAKAARRALRAGITTVRDLGDRGFLALTLREQLVASGELGPEIVASGPPITIRGGHCHFLGGVADGPQALRAAVRQRAERGCEVVKVMVSGGQLTPGSAPHQSQYDLADLRLIVAEAHRLGQRRMCTVRARSPMPSRRASTPWNTFVLHGGRRGRRPRDHGCHRRVGVSGERHGRRGTRHGGPATGHCPPFRSHDRELGPVASWRCPHRRRYRRRDSPDETARRAPLRARRSPGSG